MRKIITLCMITLLSTYVFSQQAVVPDYTKKHKTFVSVGWTCLLTGFGLQVAGAALGGLNIHLFTESTPTEKTGEALLTGGTGLMLVSVPFFIAAGHAKKKARQLSIKNEPVTILRSGSFVKQPMPALALSIRF